MRRVQQDFRWCHCVSSAVVWLTGEDERSSIRATLRTVSTRDQHQQEEMCSAQVEDGCRLQDAPSLFFWSPGNWRLFCCWVKKLIIVCLWSAGGSRRRGQINQLRFSPKKKSHCELTSHSDSCLLHVYCYSYLNLKVLFVRKIDFWAYQHNQLLCYTSGMLPSEMSIILVKKMEYENRIKE